jgi:hypothetical protein
MGLDMYALKTKARPNMPVDFVEPEDAEKIHRWRKHPNLHGWMEKLYYAKGGQNEDFNCVQLELLGDDLDELEVAIKSGTLPNTEGFFFGETDGSERNDDLAFVAEARQAIAEGFVVYYTSWW